MKSLTAVAVILLSSLALTLSGCSSNIEANLTEGKTQPSNNAAQTAKNEIPFDDGTLTMTKEEFFDLEMTQKPTDLQMSLLISNIKDQWQSANQLWEQKGSSGIPSTVDLINLAAESGNPMPTFREIANKIGRPNKYGYSSLYISYIWVTTSGKEYEISFYLPDDAPTAELIIDEDGTILNEDFVNERYQWVIYYYGIAI